MLHLPPSIERRLRELFPNMKDREHFVARVIEDALRDQPLPTSTQQSLGTWSDEEQDIELASDAQVGGTLYLFTDGGSRGNPGEAAIGCIIEDPTRGVILKEHAERIGVETNNVAEYKALIRGLEIAENFHPNRLVCHLDSELVVRQLNGEYRVKMAALDPLFERVKALSMEFPDIIFKHIPRSDNHRADALVNKVLNQSSSSYRWPSHRS